MSNITAASFAPVQLSYAAAALRGVKPRAPGTPFAYAQLGCVDALALICLAASNPEGKFFGVMGSTLDAGKAQQTATSRQATNVTFLSGTPSQMLAATSLPPLDYLAYDETAQPLTAPERDALFALAERQMKPSGLFAYHYRAYANADENLRFLVAEFAPEMNVAQAQEFLYELQALGPDYFASHPIARTALERAIAGAVPDDFFLACDAEGATESGTFTAMSGLLPRGFAFVGEADLGANYLELATPPSAHAILEGCRNHLLYEPIKDFARQRLERSDIWCRLPAERSENPAELFGGFTYGIIVPTEQVPTHIKTQGAPIDLHQPPFAGLIALMSSMPVGIGDFLNHPNGQDVTPEDAIGAMQVLVAAGVAQPMRGRYPGQRSADLAKPQWAAAFNRYLDDAPITSAQVMLASPVVGSAVSLSARDALVMQALNRVGMENSAGIVQPELQRIARDPTLAAQISEAADPSDEAVDAMIKEVINQSLIRWYGYGLLAA